MHWGVRHGNIDATRFRLSGSPIGSRHDLYDLLRCRDSLEPVDVEIAFRFLKEHRVGETLSWLPAD